jgi:lysophospholipase L1-like esterase
MRGRLSKCAAVFIALAMVGLGMQPAAADDGKGGSGQHQHEYLALGDSVPFGFSPLVDPRVASNFVGYPEDAAPMLKLALTNAACPGQTSQSFISGGPDNGCFTFRGAGLPLHTAYAGTQLDFAVSYLRSHPRTKLVTLTLGANDLLLLPCAQSTPQVCSPTDLAPVLQAYQRNLTSILKAIRKVYHRELVALNYYSTDYRNPVVTGSLVALNAVTTKVTHAFHGTTADGFTAFAKAAAGSGGDTCAAGLLIVLPTGGCNIHPSTVGAQLLASTLVSAVRHADADDDREDSLVGSANG